MTIRPADRLIVALDAPDMASAEKTVLALSGVVTTFKVGKELFTSCGPEVVRMVHGHGARVFLDLKFHDIPNTVAGACRAAAAHGVFMMNVHASGGRAMMTAAAEALRAAAPAGSAPILLGVTVLTSLSDADIAEVGIEATAAAQVERLARLAKQCGLSGVVASPQEVAAVRSVCGKHFVIVTPGVRPAWASAGDQKRVATPREAIEAGADYLVVGRPITASKDPAEAARRVLAEIEG